MRATIRKRDVMAGCPAWFVVIVEGKTSMTTALYSQEAAIAAVPGLIGEMLELRDRILTPPRHDYHF